MKARMSLTSLLLTAGCSSLDRIATAAEKVAGKTGGAMDEASNTFRVIALVAAALGLLGAVGLLAYVVIHKATERARHERHSRGGPTGGTTGAGGR